MLSMECSCHVELGLPKLLGRFEYPLYQKKPGSEETEMFLLKWYRIPIINDRPTL